MPRVVSSDSSSDSDGVAERAPLTRIQSLERAFLIVEEIARHREGIGLADVSKRVGLHSSTSFHLVRTLVSLGYIRQSPDTKRYHVGPKIFLLAASSLDEIELVDIAMPVLEDLATATGEYSHFAVRAGDDVAVIAKTAGPSAFQLTETTGVVRPAHCTALGKVLLSELKPDQLESYVQRRGLPAHTLRTITSLPRLVEELAHVRKSGIGYDDGEFDAEVRCAAVPVYSFTGHIIGAIGISCPIWRLSMQAFQEKAHKVREAADRLSAALGGRTK
jgi:DNA-binding IclR family transcriptional regulator